MDDETHIRAVSTQLSVAIDYVNAPAYVEAPDLRWLIMHGVHVGGWLGSARTHAGQIFNHETSERARLLVDLVSSWSRVELERRWRPHLRKQSPRRRQVAL